LSFQFSWLTDVPSLNKPAQLFGFLYFFAFYKASVSLRGKEQLGERTRGAALNRLSVGWLSPGL
jgi:hypothetical protein